MHRVNVLLDDMAWSALQEVPRGERSKLVSRAILKMADLERKVNAAKRMDDLRKKMSTTSGAKISHWLREDRKR